MITLIIDHIIYNTQTIILFEKLFFNFYENIYTLCKHRLKVAGRLWPHQPPLRVPPYPWLRSSRKSAGKPAGWHTANTTRVRPPQMQSPDVHILSCCTHLLRTARSCHLAFYVRCSDNNVHLPVPVVQYRHDNTVLGRWRVSRHSADSSFRRRPNLGLFKRSREKYAQV